MWGIIDVDKLGPYLLGPNDENQGIYTGDARVLAESIPDESVDLIFTDPVYDRIDDYRWLAETAARVLKPDSACLTWCSIGNLPHVISAMESFLSYVWVLDWLRHSRRMYYGKTGLTIKVPCVWMEKGSSKTHGRMADLFSTGNTKNSDGGHKWSKPLPLIAKWTSSFCINSAAIFDPFTGGGTVPAVCKMLDRCWLAFEIDPDTADLARKRVRETQPPLFVPQPEQMELELDALNN